MSDTLYDDDVLAWSEQQAALLRRAAAGERVNGLDWPNLIEEIDSVGRSELHACESLLAEALRHLMKAAGWPHSEARFHWQSEAANFLTQAQRRFAPSMRQRIDQARLYRDALYALRRERIDGVAAVTLPEASPFSLDELLEPHPELDELLARLGPPGAAAPRYQVARSS